MAKKDKAFWDQLAKDAGLDDAARTTILAAVENKKFEDAIYGAFVPREESDRILTDARKVQTDAEALKSQNVAKYNELMQWYNAAKPKLEVADTYAKQLEAYRALYGDLNGGDPNPNPNPNPAASANGAPKYITQEDLLTAQRNFWNLQQQLREADERHEAAFGKRLTRAEIREFEELAQKQENAGRTFPDLYAEWSAPKIEAKRADDWKAREEQIRKESYEQGLAKGRTHEPTASAPEEMSPLYSGRPKDEKPPDEMTIMSNFIEGMEPQAAGTNR